MSYADRLARLRELNSRQTGTPITDKTDKSPRNDGGDPLLSVLSVPSPPVSGKIAVPTNGQSRGERARLIALEVADRIRAIAPVGLGSWAPAWEIVADATDAVLDAIHAWEREGDGSDREEALSAAVNTAAMAALSAWQEAARRWVVAGRPGAPSEGQAHFSESGHPQH